MKNMNTQTGGTARAAPRARDATVRLVCLHALGVVVWLSLPTPVHAQAGTASHEARATLNQSTNMTALNTVDAPLTTTSAPRMPKDDESIRPFRFHASDEALADLRRRVQATKWPSKETVADYSQGVPLATVQNLARYWATEYDWRKVEAKLNTYPQFMTTIDGLDIHFIHVKSKEKCVAAHRDARLAWLDHRAVEDH